MKVGLIGALSVGLLLALAACSDDNVAYRDGAVPDLNSADVAGPDAASPDGPGADAGLPDTATSDGLATPDSGADAATSDGPLADGPLSDTGAPDGVVADGTMPDAQPALAAPVVTQPTAGATVFASITITGTGQAAATVVARLMLGTTELAKVSGTVDTQGDFALVLKYSGAQHNDALTLEVWQTSGSTTSPTTSVALVHNAPRTVSGDVSQSGGPNSGTAVIVRLYDSNLDQDIVNHIDQVTLNATSGQNLSATAFSFAVPDGTYYLRAFRDSGSPKGGGPDGEPTLESDAQAPARTVVVSGSNMTGQDLVLTDRTNTSDHHGDFNAVASNETPAAVPPSTWVGQTKVIGKGLCGGFLMRLSAQTTGTALTAPMARLPDGTVVTLLDDGGCGQTTLDNTASSYDFQAGDGQVSYGIPDPGTADAGSYTFFYTQTDDDFIHIQTDEVASVVKLPLLREILAPDGTTTLTAIKPAISWKAVTGATHYSVDLNQIGGGYDNSSDPGRNVSGPTYTPASNLTDDACYDLKIVAYDADPLQDTDATSNGGDSHRFCVDSDGADSITVSGQITNKTGQSAAIGIRVRTNSSDRQATTRVAAGATSYQVGVLAGSSATSGGLYAYLDVGGNGDGNSPQNTPYTVSFEQQDLQQSATVDLTFTSPVLLTGPADGATATTLTPAFGWQDYAQTAGPSKPTGAFSYAFFIGESNFPSTIYALPSSATGLDMGNLPAAGAVFDVVPMATCLQSGGTFSQDASGAPQCSGGTMQSSASALTAATSYSWGVTVFECDFSTYDPSGPSTSFLSCVSGILSGNSFYAKSENRTLITP